MMLGIDGARGCTVCKYLKIVDQRSCSVHHGDHRDSLGLLTLPPLLLAELGLETEALMPLNLPLHDLLRGQPLCSQFCNLLRGQQFRLGIHRIGDKLVGLLDVVCIYLSSP